MKVKTVLKILVLSTLPLVLAACDAIAAGDDTGALEASGFIEVVEAVAAPELGGQVVEVFVDQGDAVQAGDPLFRLDDSLLAAQRAQAVVALEVARAAQESATASAKAAGSNLASAQAGVEVAQSGVDAAEAGVQAAEAGVLAAQLAQEQAETSYQLALSVARLEERPERVAAWAEAQPEQIITPPWYFDPREQVSSIEAEFALAEQALNDRTADLANLISDPAYDQVVEAERRLAQAQATFQVAAEIRDRAIAQDDVEGLDDAVQELYDQALADLEAAQDDEVLFNSPEGEAILEARARLAAAKERFETAADHYYALFTGDSSLSVTIADSASQAAAAAVDQAKAQQTAAEAGVAQAEALVSQAEATVDALEAQVDGAENGLAQAELGVELAQAALDAIDKQIEKMTVSAAVSGVVMVRSIQPGEVVGPGAPAITIGLLDEMTVTVYLPENQYGQVSVGDRASVSVDSYPDETFTAEVSVIADQAEFTPRNVQTTEERQTTVYAVELRITDPDGRLKPGMPADVVFETNE